MQTLKVVRLGRVCEPGTQYTSPCTVKNLLHKTMNYLDREHFVVLHLDNRKCLIAKETISIGSANSTTVHPREVFKAAVINGSSALILVHNHPSGNPAPSDDDINITSRLRAAGDLLGIKVLDHIIIGADDYFSFEEAALPLAYISKAKEIQGVLS